MLRTMLLALAALAATALLALPSLAASNAQTVRVTETNYRISLSAKPRAGVVRFAVRNASDDGHDFWLRGGGKTFRTRGLAEGGSASLTATVKRGVRYQYWCAVGSHAAKGMRGSFVAR
jgi:plastocyanin